MNNVAGFKYVGIYQIGQLSLYEKEKYPPPSVIV
jgi:hypothetical protein